MNRTGILITTAALPAAGKFVDVDRHHHQQGGNRQRRHFRHQYGVQVRSRRWVGGCPCPLYLAAYAGRM